MNTISIVTFILATGSVAYFTYRIVQKMKKSNNATEEYFTGGRALTWPVVAGSLLLTNLSTEQLVGLNGDVFGDKAMVGLAWEALAAFAMIATALVFLPRYLASGFTTTPAFLEKRFDKTTRSMVSGLFLFGYVTVLLPVVLYTGSLALERMFNLNIPLWLIIILIGTLGSSYAIFGGLKSVAVSDTINGIGLLIGGLAIPFLGLSALGDGSFFSGVSTLLNDKPEYLTVLTRTNLEGKTVSVPWPTLFTGMMFIQVFYWSTNQVIVQRAMAAKSLAEGQKGVLFASAMKLVGPLMLCLPGIIALHMTELPIGRQDQVYGALVRYVLPDWSLGLFAAVLMGSILSSFNSALNSASTLFSLQFYKGYINKNATGDQIVNIGKQFGILLAVASMIIAPLLAQTQSIFQYLQKVNGLYSVPIIGIFLLGITTKHVPAVAAKVGMVVGMAIYAFFSFENIHNVPDFFADGSGDLHWLHGYFISFVSAVLVMLAIGKFQPKTPEEIAISDQRDPAPVDMTPWSESKKVSMGIMGATFAIYLLLSMVAQ
ncbi:MAG: solute:sodium symporter family transporter [Candidatus Neomarinimicrobiota bacterium]|jgi:SSS family solute:Na+ symporter|nr:solute:sodium symporter family transporter [Candidatus Neomarinimicrobiota bacterium]MEC9437102.1 solute:sodium symporter family transporter [Candidatus Neomarinimicrobiota bacterium]MEC9474581.1 solute:sodium symporter family transporter [Candidatus Neomarinimicrobiota bacterium]MED5434327.1 solute:sodium symporter family transporter [Candidatus Neomarinimicrobiota bacterium]